MKKDYTKECGLDICDGGVGCKQATNPPLSLCKRCFCYNCTRGKCQPPRLTTDE